MKIQVLERLALFWAIRAVFEDKNIESLEVQRPYFNGPSRFTVRQTVLDVAHCAAQHSCCAPGVFLRCAPVPVWLEDFWPTIEDFWPDIPKKTHRFGGFDTTKILEDQVNLSLFEWS